MNKLVKRDSMPLAVLVQRNRELNWKAAEVLAPERRKMVEAGLSAKIIDREQEEVETELITIITSTYSIAGQKADPGTLAIYASEFYGRLIEVYPRVTIDEIRQALRNGVYDEYGEYFGLNVKTFIFFIRSYINSDARRKAVEEWSASRERLSESLPDERKNIRASANYSNELYFLFLAGKLEFDLIPAFLYDFMSRVGILQDELNVTRAGSYYYTVLNNDRSRFVANILHDGKERERKSAIIMVAKQFAIWDFFQRCKDWRRRAIFLKYAI
ncbi:hypothetical protein [Chitinophaga sp. CF418]|uniref:hypothetical protein n=1 Tax=Chitinophaga sp. CF418 TaxID=1855287 RepID=UPI0009134BAE|nr:hypothetical protein [Chitinophaga sp. CF418]SHN42284.1 hypothetical protein SAMN05216311_114166 [Chitinophaga sp. CF418]